MASYIVKPGSGSVITDAGYGEGGERNSIAENAKKRDSATLQARRCGGRTETAGLVRLARRSFPGEQLHLLSFIHRDFPCTRLPGTHPYVIARLPP